MKPEISIVVPVYNAEKFIGPNITSLLHQRGLVETPYEIICVNDGSTDETAQILEKWKRRIGREYRLRIIEKDNGGIARAINTGIEKAQGKYLVFVDNDDILNDYALAKLHERLKHGQFPLVAGQHSGFDSITGKIIFTTHKENFLVKGSKPEEEPLLRAYGIGHPKMVSRKTAEQVGGFDPSTGFTSDYDFVLKTIFPGEIKPWGLINAVLYYYRLHNSCSVVNRSTVIEDAERSLNNALKRLGISGNAKYAGRNNVGYLSYTF